MGGEDELSVPGQALLLRGAVLLPATQPWLISLAQGSASGQEKHKFSAPLTELVQVLASHWGRGK